MANEFKHKTVGTQLTQTEFEAVGGHVLDSQAAGDIIYASSTTQLSRLGIGTAGKLLAVNSGATAPEYVAALTGVTSVLNTALVIGRDADNDIDFATDNTILFRADGADQIKLTNGALLPVTDDDIDLGSSSLQFKDGHFDGTVEADAITVGGTAVLTGGAVTSITSLLNISLVLGRDADNDIDFGTDNNIIFRAGAQDQIKLIDGALAPVTDNDVDLGTSSLEFKDAFFDGTVTSDAFAGPLTGDVTGNADTATALATGRTIGMTGDVVWTSASFTGAGNVTGSATIQSTSVESGMLNNNIISGQTEITSGLADADELLYSDGGVLKRVGLDTLSTKVLTGNAASATILATARAINGVDFDGSAAITVTAAGSTLSDTVTVAKGGTNATSLADKAVLITQDSGTDTVSAAAMSTNGQLLIGGSSGPAVATLTAGSNVTITNADGGITIASTQATDATNSSHVLVTDNESTDEDNLITFVENGTSSTGNVGLEMDGTLTYNPSTGKVTATGFVGTLTGNVTGNVSGTAATVTSGTQANITTLANLTTSGALNAGSITSGFTSIDVGAGTIDTTGAVSTGNLSPAGDVAIADAKVIKLGGTRPADNEPATNNTGYGIVVLFDAGAAVAIGDAVSVDGNGRVIKTVADATGTLSGPCIGIATTAATNADDDVYVMTHGIFRHDDWGLTAGSAAYIEEADPGDLSATAPNDDGDYVQRVGVAVKDDVLLVMPSIDVIEHTG
jgi:hypothetical protein